MSDKQALLAEKQDLIKKMIELQKQFMDIEHEKGISGKDYFYAQEGLLKDYRETFQDMANRVVDLAHEINGQSARHF